MQLFGLLLLLPCTAFSMSLATKDDIPPPPPHEQVAEMSRYLVHYFDWLALATESTLDNNLQGTPFASVFSFADGPMEYSTGIPYFYLTNMDMSTQDLLVNAKTSATISLAQGTYCADNGLDQEDPRCAHVILAGEMVPLETNSLEEDFAKQALYARHPAMAEWPTDHGWYFAKLELSNVILLDFFGGAIDVPLEDYYNVQL